MQRQWARLARRGWCAGVVPTAPRSLERIRREMRQAEPPAARAACEPIGAVESAPPPQKGRGRPASRWAWSRPCRHPLMGVLGAWSAKAPYRQKRLAGYMKNESKGGDPHSPRERALCKGTRGRKRKSTMILV